VAPPDLGAEFFAAPLAKTRALVAEPGRQLVGLTAIGPSQDDDRDARPSAEDRRRAVALLPVDK
jgi:hypothetical protein